MSWPRSTIIWALAGMLTVTVLGAAIYRTQKYSRQWWANFLVGDPHTGAAVFQRSGCAQCHSVNGMRRGSAPDLGFDRAPHSSLNELVAAMWNHAPVMWDEIRSRKLRYPQLDTEDMAHLAAYLYASRYVDEPGNAFEGKRLFNDKGCVRCHAVRGEGGRFAPDLSTVGNDTPIAWTQSMWNHAPAMEAAVREAGLPWPSFKGREMVDLLAYVREVSTGPRSEFKLLPADPDRGAKLFQAKSCAVCHSLGDKADGPGPPLGKGHTMPRSIVEFAGLMWNHSPEMYRSMSGRHVERPHFEGREMADLLAFLYSSHYFEGTGSPDSGKKIFSARGCAECHGRDAQGTRSAPELRRRGEVFTSINLATALWRHGPEMYRKCQERGQGWPNLSEQDVSELVSYLGAPPEEKR